MLVGSIEEAKELCRAFDLDEGDCIHPVPGVHVERDGEEERNERAGLFSDALADALLKMHEREEADDGE